MTGSTLIIDAGGTSTKWAFITSGGREYFTTPGINLAIASDRQLHDLIECGSELLGEASHIYFYGAGATGKETETKLLRAFSRYASDCIQIEVASDLLGACRSLFGDGSGIGCILGTGANSCYYNGKTSEGIVRHIRPLGFILGDEGSGASLGKNLAAAALRDEIDDPIFIEEFYSMAGGAYEYIIKRIYRTPAANAYLASFAPLALKYKHLEQIEQIIVGNLTQFFSRFVSRYLEDFARKDKVVDIGFVGSLALALSDEIARECSKYPLRLVDIQASPLEGLIKYHTDK